MRNAYDYGFKHLLDVRLSYHLSIFLDRTTGPSTIAMDIIAIFVMSLTKTLCCLLLNILDRDRFLAEADSDLAFVDIEEDGISN